MCAALVPVWPGYRMKDDLPRRRCISAGGRAPRGGFPVSFQHRQMEGPLGSHADFSSAVVPPHPPLCPSPGALSSARRTGRLPARAPASCPEYRAFSLHFLALSLPDSAVEGASEPGSVLPEGTRHIISSVLLSGFSGVPDSSRVPPALDQEPTFSARVLGLLLLGNRIYRTRCGGLCELRLLGFFAP